jgi:uncharacterized protein YozE (UPF0346 family)
METMEQIKAEYDHLSKDMKEVLSWWLNEFVRPEKHFNHQQSSYLLKHLFEEVVHAYLSNGQLKMAMLKTGYKPLDMTELNWHFKIRKVDIRPKVKSFYDWCISKFADMDNAGGDLARDMRGDRDCPKTVAEKSVIFNYLIRRRACKEALDTFNRVWNLYEDEVLKTNRTTA